jgi:hypothetical protein
VPSRNVVTSVFATLYWRSRSSEDSASGRGGALDEDEHEDEDEDDDVVRRKVDRTGAGLIFFRSIVVGSLLGTG